MPIEFLNVDLELESKKSLQPILDELGDAVHVLYNGKSQTDANLLALEVYEGDDQDPESIVNAFCKLIEKLSPRSKALWKTATFRRFDIGFESGISGQIVYADLTPKTLVRIAALNADLVLTLYPAEKPKAVKKTVKKAPAAKKPTTKKK